MIISEQEAKTKWCPFAPPELSEKCGAAQLRDMYMGRKLSNDDEKLLKEKFDEMRTKVSYGDPEGHKFFDTTLGTRGAKCITSACMAWEWERIPNRKRMAGITETTYENSTTHGQCGMIKADVGSNPTVPSKFW